jgi:hypothetical protein
MQNSLPDEWIDRIFLRLQGVYGKDFTSQFKIIDPVTGVDVGMENAKQTWGEELATFADWPEAIGYALKHLPERPPNIIRFRELCRNAPPKETAPALPHRVTETEREKNRGVAKQAFQSLAKKPTDDGRDWARQILANPFYDDGRPRSPACIKIAQKALGL